ncbi:MAG: hypothetical protein DMD75_09050 [Candidatus Rokuibacteriota bacterium]|nr:MAG: hypothetical protein DMD75_09050 [Candidatus Rokubacteria bacterium]
MSVDDVGPPFAEDAAQAVHLVEQSPRGADDVERCDRGRSGDSAERRGAYAGRVVMLMHGPRFRGP